MYYVTKIEIEREHTDPLFITFIKTSLRFMSNHNQV